MEKQEGAVEARVTALIKDPFQDVHLPAEEDRSNSYFVVAVARRDSAYSFTLDELRSKRSCHPGLGSPAGWDVPIGALIQRGFIRPKDCDVLTGTSL